MSASAWFAIVIGAVSLCIGIFKGLWGMLDAKTKEKKCTHKATATITELKVKMIRKKMYYVPTYEYEIGGVKYARKTSPELPNEHKIGQTEHILVDPDKPSRMLPAKGAPSNSASVFYIFTIVGVVCLAYGVISLI